MCHSNTLTFSKLLLITVHPTQNQSRVEICDRPPVGQVGAGAIPSLRDCGQFAAKTHFGKYP